MAQGAGGSTPNRIVEAEEGLCRFHVLFKAAEDKDRDRGGADVWAADFGMPCVAPARMWPRY